MPDTRRQIEFEHLALAASCCRACARMGGTSAVLGHRNGDIGSRLLFVAEAPGRLGAARTGVPLSSDQSGRNFERLLSAAGLTREHVFITNAVLCNPLDIRGRNAPPTNAEIHNCRAHLAETLRIVDPAVVVALGSVALRALDRIVPHRLTLSTDVGKPANWNGRLLVPMYHPGARARIHRSLRAQLQDFASLRPLLREVLRE